MQGKGSVPIHHSVEKTGFKIAGGEKKEKKAAME